MMTFDFIKHKEKENLIPVVIENKEKYYRDLLNIENSWTGRLDAAMANTFIQESNLLLINSIVLFEQGYFDCAYYSLRQSLEVSTTMIYLIDCDKETRERELQKWKEQSRFPMYSQMIKFLESNQSVYSDMKGKMQNYFEELNAVKEKLNKYVHKQGFKTFYTSRNHPLNLKKDRISFIKEFERYLQKCIGAVAILRLTIDPFPILLMDEKIYSRTGDLMTTGYTDDFVEKYVGFRHIEDYKKTDMYRNLYNSIIQEEAMEPCVIDVVKGQYIDKDQIDMILKQRHLLSQNDLIAVVLCGFSKKVSKVYCFGGLKMYFSSNQSVRKKLSWSGMDFKNFEKSENKYNQLFDEAYITCLTIYKEVYFIEHNEKLNNKEIEKLEFLVKINTTLN